MPKLPRSADGGTKAKARSRNKNAVKEAAGSGSRMEHKPVGTAAATNGAAVTTIELNEFERGLLGDLFAVIEEHAGDAGGQIDRELIERAFVFACERHADQRRQSGEDFIVHPVVVAKICYGMLLDTATLLAAILLDIE